MKTLIADDDPVSCAVLENLLSGWGYEPLQVSDGAEAWRHLHKAKGSLLVLLDWMMPNMSGIEVCRRVRKELRSASIYIILLSGRSARGDVIQGLREGADDYVTKPYDPEELRARLNAGLRILHLQQRLSERVAELEVA